MHGPDAEQSDRQQARGADTVRPVDRGVRVHAAAGRLRLLDQAAPSARRQPLRGGCELCGFASAAFRLEAAAAHRREYPDCDGVIRIVFRSDHLTLLGDLDLAVAERLTTRLEELKGGGGPVRLDLSRLAFIDSSGIQAILVALADARWTGWQLDIAPEVSPSVARATQIVGTAPAALHLSPGQVRCGGWSRGQKSCANAPSGITSRSGSWEHRLYLGPYRTDRACPQPYFGPERELQLTRVEGISGEVAAVAQRLQPPPVRLMRGRPCLPANRSKGLTAQASSVEDRGGR